MAEKDLSIDSNGDAAPDSSLSLKKRARRRLVGAIALALLAVIVLPMVMDQEPRPLNQDIQIRIPSQESGVSTFVTKISPRPAPAVAAIPVAPAAPATPAQSPQVPATPAPSAAVARAVVPATAPAVVPKPETRPESKPEAAKIPLPPKAATPESKAPAKPAESPAAKSAESVRAAAILNDEHWVIQLGAYQDAANVKAIAARIKALGLPVFTEKIDTPQGSRTRVRSGPFASREVAEKAQARLKKIGLGAPLGGVVAQAQ